MHMHYILEGSIDQAKAEKALKLSVEKYCSVSKALEKASDISYSIEIKEK